MDVFDCGSVFDTVCTDRIADPGTTSLLEKPVAYTADTETEGTARDRQCPRKPNAIWIAE